MGWGSVTLAARLPRLRPLDVSHKFSRPTPRTRARRGRGGSDAQLQNAPDVQGALCNAPAPQVPPSIEGRLGELQGYRRGWIGISHVAIATGVGSLIRTACGIAIKFQRVNLGTASG